MPGRDPLVRDSAAVAELGVVAYVGMPLFTSDGHVLGSFCVIDTAPRIWTIDELALLRDFAAAAMTEIALREREFRLEAQYQAFPLPTYTWRTIDGDFIFTDYNAAARASSGKSLRNPWARRPALSTTPCRRCKRLPVTLLRRADHPQHELRYPVTTGRQILEFIVTYVYVAPDQVVMHAEDITARKAAETALRASEASLAEAQRIAHLWELGVQLRNGPTRLFRRGLSDRGVYTRDIRPNPGGCAGGDPPG